MYPQISSTENSCFAATSEIRKKAVFLAFMFPAMLGIVIFFAGIIVEQRGQIHLMEQDWSAYLAYKAAFSVPQYLSFFEMVGHAFKWQLTSFGGNQQCIGLVLALGLAPLSALLVVAYRGMSAITKYFSTRNESDA